MGRVSGDINPNDVEMTAGAGETPFAVYLDHFDVTTRHTHSWFRDDRRDTQTYLKGCVCIAQSHTQIDSVSSNCLVKPNLRECFLWNIWL